MMTTEARVRIVPIQKTKLGDIASVSLPAGIYTTESGEMHIVCPGASKVCAAVCYAKGYRFRAPTVRLGYQRNYLASLSPEFASDLIEQILKLQRKNRKAYGDGYVQVVRMHVSGDFHSVLYVLKWLKVVQALPDVRFYAYTRSWTIPEVMPSLERLRALPNMQLFASVDESMPMPPEGWRVAYMETDKRFRGMECLEQIGKKPDCKACGYCFLKSAGNVKFLLH